MTLRNLTKVRKLCLIYFGVDKSTCIVETKRLRSKETGEHFEESGPVRGDKVAVKTGGKLLDTIAVDCYCHSW